ncbi:hypothetical protein LTR53_008909 [Teratosphaeriaceae sp. CCFEE 6253]|nr:hypothetical protein LTR53_008909 [Teratosphaeriaceae sp. CCFEE 6253]
MARLNTRPSNVPSSRYTSATSGATSDQENRDPSARYDKGRARAMPPPSRASLPTPSSDGSDGARGQKRKRVTVHVDAPPEEEVDEDERKFTEFYDPNQDAKERREAKRRSRALEREYLDNRDSILRGDGAALDTTINRANNLFKRVKQTGDATIDSRLMVNVSDLAYKQTAALIQQDKSTGIDVDEFLSKCITYMRNGGPINDDDDDAPAASTARRRTTRTRDDDDDDDEASAEALDFELLGRHACYPFNARPPVPSFLLGPLSVEKKQRTQTQRRARQTKDTAGRESRPEALTKEDLTQKDENELTAICTRIRQQLLKHIRWAGDEFAASGFSERELQEGGCREWLREHRISADLGVPLFEFVLHPRSFGQTVENLFYISFLIKEGSVGVSHDGDGLPVISMMAPLLLPVWKLKTE